VAVPAAEETVVMKAAEEVVVTKAAEEVVVTKAAEEAAADSRFPVSFAVGGKIRRRRFFL